MRKKRKQYTAEEKVAILQKHILEKIPVSELCDEYEVAAHCVLSLAEAAVRTGGRDLFSAVTGQRIDSAERTDHRTGSQASQEERGPGRGDGGVCGAKITRGHPDGLLGAAASAR